jgi:hypothetical protein
VKTKLTSEETKPNIGNGRTASHENLKESCLNPDKRLSKRIVTTGGSGGSRNSRKVLHRRTMQDFSSLEKATDLIQNFVKGTNKTDSLEANTLGSGSNVSEGL